MRLITVTSFSALSFVMTIALNAFGQQYGMRQYFSKSDSALIGLRTHVELNSSFLTSRFYYSAFSGKGLSSSETDRISNRSSDLNRLGFEVDAGFYASIPVSGKNAEAPKSRFIIGLFDRQLLTTSFDNDLGKVFIDGNKHYRGKVVQMNLDVQFIRAQELQLGWQSKLGKWDVIGAVSFLNGEQFASASSTKLELYTTTYGESVSLNTSLDIQQSDTTNRGFGSPNGLGASFGMLAHRELKPNKQLKSHFIEIELRDLGVISWNENSVDYSVDSNYYFEGVFIEDLFDFNDSTLENSGLDTALQDIRKNGVKGTQTLALPAVVAISYFAEFSNHWYASGHLSYRQFPGLIPQLIVRGGKHLKHGITIGSMVGYGGYGGFRLGFEGGLKWGNWNLTASTNNLEGLFLWNYSGGVSGFLNLRRKI